MAWTVALSEMLLELRRRFGARRSTSLTDAVLTPFLNSGIAEVHHLIAEHNPDYLVVSADINTVAGTATVALPSTFYKARRLDLVEGTNATRLRRFEIDEETYLDESTIWDSGSSTGRPRWMPQAGNIRFVPVPTAIYTVRLWYIPHAVKLVSAGDIYTGVNGHEDLVYEHALRLCKVKDRMPTQDHDLAIGRLEKRLLSALGSRDQSEPEYLPDLGRGAGW
jgi:hypothetical protein